MKIDETVDYKNTHAYPINLITYRMLFLLMSDSFANHKSHIIANRCDAQEFLDVMVMNCSLVNNWIT